MFWLLWGVVFVWIVWVIIFIVNVMKVLNWKWNVRFYCMGEGKIKIDNFRWKYFLESFIWMVIC